MSDGLKKFNYCSVVVCLCQLLKLQFTSMSVLTNIKYVVNTGKELNKKCCLFVCFLLNGSYHYINDTHSRT